MGVIHMLQHLSHVGFVFHSVYCLAILLSLCVVYVLSFVLGSATSPVGDVVKVLDLVLWSAVLPSSSELIKVLTFVLWSPVPPSSVASQSRPFSTGNRPAFLRINQS